MIQIEIIDFTILILTYRNPFPPSGFSWNSLDKSISFINIYII